jgi:hypothetical protein
MKALLLLFASVLFSAPAHPDHLAEIKMKKTGIDQYEFKHRKEMLVFLKLEGKSKLIRPKTEDLPDDAEYVQCVKRRIGAYHTHRANSLQSKRGLVY